MAPSRIQKTWGIVRLLRLSNALPAAALVLLGGWLAQGMPLPGPVWLAAGAMVCITAYGYVSNDLADLAEDRVNKPDRPLPSGLVAPQTARWMTIFLAVCGLFLSLSIGGRLPIGSAGVTLGLLTWYNRRLKGTSGRGNLLIGGLAGLTLSVGGFAAAGWGGAIPNLLPGTVLVAFITARELLKTAEDVAGDRAAGKMTAAIHHGSPWVIRRVALLAGITGLLSLLPVALMGYTWAYLAVMAVGVVGPLVGGVIYLWRDAQPQRVSRVLALLKGSYFAGLLALLLAAVLE